MSDLNKMQTQKNEFNALYKLFKAYDAMPPIVDDYYPEARHHYENALHAFVIALRDNNRITANAKTWREPKIKEENSTTIEFLSQLREASKTRDLEMTKGASGVFSLSFRGNELAGETGEACNVLKKLDRERLGIVGSRDTVEHLREELADIIICVDLTLMDLNIEPATFIQDVRNKFNKTSHERNLRTML